MSTFVVPARSSKTYMDLNSTKNLVDPEWELIDPIPDIHKLFHNFNVKFFNGKLACVELEWSKRMYQCAGICYSRRSRGQMSCIIRLSEPLLKLRSRKELVETLLHEMIHAFNFIRGILEANGGHGPNFLEKMREINRLAGTNITVYHTFHDEVELYRKHWWRCDGICKTQKPYFGYVKRTSNRAPGPNDFWWSQHLKNCGGKFIKVKEPEKKNKSKDQKPKEKIIKKQTKEKTPVKTDSNFPISIATSSKVDEVIVKPNSFGGENLGLKLGGSGSGRSRLLDIFDNKKKEVKTEKKDAAIKRPRLEIETKDSFIHKSVKTEIMHEFDDEDDIILIDDEYDDGVIEIADAIVKKEPKKEIEESLCNCPICNERVNVTEINVHIDECLTMQMLTEIS